MVQPKLVMLLPLLCVLASASAQYRPSYFPRPGGFDKVLPQYQPEVETGNRDNVPSSPPPSNMLEDVQLTNRVQEWSRPNQPFWFINAQHIAQHTGQKVPCEGPNCPQQFTGAAPQSSFLGTRGRAI